MKRWTLGAACLAVAMTFPLLGGARAHAAAFQVVEATIEDIHAAMRTGRLTTRQLVEMYLARIDAYDKAGPAINSIITLNPAALADADRLDAAFKAGGFVGPLHGIVVLVKDEVDTVGMPTTQGTLVFKDYMPTRDAFAVERLKAQGALILGKTTLSEYAAGDTYGSMFGGTRNPYALDRTAGGSSGGSGAALAANFSTLAVGEETVSSIRRPGAWNALAALRPTPGLVSRAGMWDGAPSPVAQMGPMARTVRDLALMLDGMVGFDAEDPVTALGVGRHEGSYTRHLDKDGLKGARIGVLRMPIGRLSEPGSDDFRKVDAVFDRSVQDLRDAGATVIDPIVIPDLALLLSKEGRDPTTANTALEIYLARNPNSPFKDRADIGRSPDLAKAIPPGKADQWLQPLQETDPSVQLAHLQAREQLLYNIISVMAQNRLDAIVLKTVEHQPPLIAEAMAPPWPPSKGVVNLNTFVVHASVITVPAGMTGDDIPAGLTFFGGPFSEPTLFRLAYAYEQATRRRAPPASTPELPAARER